MARFRNRNGILIVVLLAAVGLLLVYVPPTVLEQYERVKALGPPYTYFYWGMVGSGAAILLVLGVGIVAKLWRATRAKAARRERGAKNPSALSSDEQQRELADNLAAVDDLQRRQNLS
jgi:hypothetical protein